MPVKPPTIPVEMNGGLRKAPVMVVSPAFKQKAGSTPLPALSTSSVVGGDPKKITQTKPVVNVPIVKGNSGNPSYNKSPNTPSPEKKATTDANEKANLPKPVKINTIKKTPETRKVESKQKKVNIVPAKRPNKTLKKNYTAKKITIHMENTSKVRKTRDAVRRNVANMELKEITKKLRDRGLIRETANPPENIQRSMMIDILLFPAPI